MTVAAGGTIWVTAINVLLGLVTLGLLLVVAGAALKEAIRHLHARGPENEADREVLRRLGITLPDGGEPIDEMEELKKPDRGSRTAKREDGV